MVSSVTPRMPASILQYQPRLVVEPLADRREEDALFFVGRLRDERRILLGARAEGHEQRRVAAVVEDHVGPAAVGPLEDAVRELPVFLQAFALVGEHRDAGGGDRGRGMILRREDVARRPAHLGAELDQRLDQHRRLDRHVQRPDDARALQRLLVLVLLAHRHEAGHLGLGDRDLAAAEIGRADIGYVIVLALGRTGYGVHHALLSDERKKFVSAVAGESGSAEPGRGNSVATLLGGKRIIPQGRSRNWRRHPPWRLSNRCVK